VLDGWSKLIILARAWHSIWESEGWTNVGESPRWSRSWPGRRVAWDQVAARGWSRSWPNHSLLIFNHFLFSLKQLSIVSTLLFSQQGMGLSLSMLKINITSDRIAAKTVFDLERLVANWVLLIKMATNAGKSKKLHVWLAVGHHFAFLSNETNSPCADLTREADDLKGALATLRPALQVVMLVFGRLIDNDCCATNKFATSFKQNES